MLELKVNELALKWSRGFAGKQSIASMRHRETTTPCNVYACKKVLYWCGLLGHEQQEQVQICDGGYIKVGELMHMYNTASIMMMTVAMRFACEE